MRSGLKSTTVAEICRRLQNTEAKNHLESAFGFSQSPAETIDVCPTKIFEDLFYAPLINLLNLEPTNPTGEQKAFYDLVYACLIAIRTYCLATVGEESKYESKQDQHLVYLSEEAPIDINDVPLPIPSNYTYPGTTKPLRPRDLHYLANTVAERKAVPVLIHQTLSEEEKNELKPGFLKTICFIGFPLIVGVVLAALLTSLTEPRTAARLGAIYGGLILISLLGAVAGYHLPDIYHRHQIAKASNRVPERAPAVINEMLTTIAITAGFFSSSKPPEIRRPTPAAARFGIVL